MDRCSLAVLVSVDARQLVVNDDVEPVSAGLVGTLVDDRGATTSRLYIVVARTRGVMLTMVFVE